MKLALRVCGHLAQFPVAPVGAIYPVARESESAPLSTVTTDRAVIRGEVLSRNLPPDTIPITVPPAQPLGQPDLLQWLLNTPAALPPRVVVGTVRASHGVVSFPRHVPHAVGAVEATVGAVMKAIARIVGLPMCLIALRDDILLSVPRAVVPVGVSMPRAALHFRHAHVLGS